MTQQTRESLVQRGRDLSKRFLRKLFPNSFPDTPDFESVARSAQALRCDLQYLMDINPASRWFSPVFVANFGGFHPPGDERMLNVMHPGDRVRSDMLLLLLREITVRKVPGAMAELGVHRGTSARLLHHYCPERKLYLFDTFAGFPEKDFAKESINVGYNQRQQFTDTDVDIVLRAIAPLNSNVIPIVGWFPASATPQVSSETFAFIHLDADLEAPISAGLDFFWPRLSTGGIVVVHDYNAWPGSRVAVDRFLLMHHAAAVPMPDKSGSIVLVKV
jgi:O-methyltransferase